MSTHATAETPTRAQGPVVVGVACTLVALAVLLPGLGAHGLWTDAELPVVARSRAALGAALGNLERSPWLPDAIRTWAYSAVGGELGIRLPHALSVAGLVGIAGALARARGASLTTSALAAAFVLSLPGSQTSGRLVLGNPVGELAGVLAIVLAVAALARRPAIPAIVLAIGAAAMLVASIASSGLFLGGALPLAVVAASQGGRLRAGVLWTAAVAAVLGALILVLRQEDGYIPLLGAARDLDVLEKPQSRVFSAGLEELGFQVFPWLPIAVIGALNPGRERWPALWLILALTMSMAWAVPYGLTAAPLGVPVGLCCARAVEHVLDAQPPRAARRLALLVILGGVFVLSKDAQRTPSMAASPLHDFEGEHRYPAAELGTPALLASVSSFALLSFVVLGALAPRSRSSEPGLRDRAIAVIPPWVRDRLGPSTLFVALLSQAAIYGHAIIPRTADGLSTRATLERWRSWADAGHLPTTLAVHRVRDQALEFYGPTPDHLDKIDSRGDLTKLLSADEPAAVLIRATDLPAVHQHHRHNGWPLYVLTDDHVQLMLVSNVLPPGAENFNPIERVVFDEAPALTNQTLLEFDERIQIVGWELDSPVVRGTTRTLKLAIKVLRNLPGGAKMHARLQRGKTSRVNANFHELTGDVYPCNYWRAGDYILHTYEFKTPTLEILPGAHDFVIALRRSEKSNYEISRPAAGEASEFPIRIKDSQRTFAVIGQVDVW